MRKGSRKMWWVVSSRSKKNSVRPESRMDIEEILKMKLETIKEEPEIVSEENGATIKREMSISNKVIKKIHMKVKMRKLFTSQLNLKESYVLFMTGFASKGGLAGLPRY